MEKDRLSNGQIYQNNLDDTSFKFICNKMVEYEPSLCQVFTSIIHPTQSQPPPVPPKGVFYQFSVLYPGSCDPMWPNLPAVLLHRKPKDFIREKNRMDFIKIT